MNIRHKLEDTRRHGLTQFFAEFMQVLQSEGYTFEDLIESAASYAHNQKYSEEIIKKLEDLEGGEMKKYFLMISVKYFHNQSQCLTTGW